MTKFINLGETSKVKNPTKFEYFLAGRTRAEAWGGMLRRTTAVPSEYDTVTFIGRDRIYGDVFKAECEHNEGEFNLFFGIKGDEFD